MITKSLTTALVLLSSLGIAAQESPHPDYRQLQIEYWDTNAGLKRVKECGYAVIAADGSLLKAGTWTQWHDNGVKAEEGSYQEGTNQGLWTGWYANGKLRHKETYAGGRMHGESSIWLTNGNRHEYAMVDDSCSGGKIFLAEESSKVDDICRFYIRQMLSGEVGVYFAQQLKQTIVVRNGERVAEVLYYPSGKQFRIDHYHNNGYGDKIGKAVWFYPKGQKATAIDYDAKEDPEGTQSSWWPSGELAGEMIYKGGKPWQGLRLELAKTGAYQLASYKDGQLHGLQATYWANGKKKLEAQFNEGELVGARAAYHDNGSKMWEVNVKDGQLAGVLTFWTPDGSKEAELIVQDGEPWDGTQILYDDNGCKEAEKRYRDGQQHGLEICYYANGRKKSEVNWSNGKQVADPAPKFWDEIGSPIEAPK